MTPQFPEDRFFDLKAVAVAGVSHRKTKYGRIVYDKLKAAGMNVYPVNPKASDIAGDKCYPSLSALPEKPEGVSIVLPPPITLRTAEEAVKIGVKMVWMQPGAEHPEAVRMLEAAGIAVVHGGPCILVALGRVRHVP